jgi:hypothetical protein
MVDHWPFCAFTFSVICGCHTEVCSPVQSCCHRRRHMFHQEHMGSITEVCVFAQEQVQHHLALSQPYISSASFVIVAERCKIPYARYLLKSQPGSCCREVYVLLRMVYAGISTWAHAHAGEPLSQRRGPHVGSGLSSNPADPESGGTSGLRQPLLEP